MNEKIVPEVGDEFECWLNPTNGNLSFSSHNIKNGYDQIIRIPISEVSEYSFTLNLKGTLPEKMLGSFWKIHKDQSLFDSKIIKKIKICKWCNA